MEEPTMTNHPDMTLMAYLGMGPVQQVAKTQLFGGPYLRFADFVNVSGWLYQTGALIARAKLDKLMLLAKMFSQPGREGDVISWTQELAKKRLDTYVDAYSQQPTSIAIFILATEYKRAGIMFPLGYVGALTDTRMKQVVKVANTKMPFKDAELFLQNSVLEGIGFGSSFPMLTEKMYREANEDIDLTEWSEARKHGLDIPETPTIITLEEQEHLVLSMVATYAQAYSPELVASLGLTEFLSEDAGV